jgi:hypothetical protein
MNTSYQSCRAVSTRMFPVVALATLLSAWQWTPAVGAESKTAGTANEPANVTATSVNTAILARLAGVWNPTRPPTELDTNPVFTPLAQEEVNEQVKRLAKGDISEDTSARCIPPSMPTMTSLAAQELLVDHKKITWISESANAIRWIFLDGRKHPPRDELRPTAMGNSIGHWEGNTLVVDTVGFMPSSRYYVNLPDNVSLSPGPDMHVIERLHLENNGNVLVNERTHIDPKNLAQPWITTVRYDRKSDWEIGEIICAENNHLKDY